MTIREEFAEIVKTADEDRERAILFGLQAIKAGYTAEEAYQLYLMLGRKEQPAH